MRRVWLCQGMAAGGSTCPLPQALAEACGNQGKKKKGPCVQQCLVPGKDAAILGHNLSRGFLEGTMAIAVLFPFGKKIQGNFKDSWM